MIHKSSSREQQDAEAYLFCEMQKKLDVPLEKNKILYLTEDHSSYIQPDFFSAEHHVIGEIFAHIGKPKKAQDNKIANDILKMLLYEKKQNIDFRKIIVVCDREEARKLRGKSALAVSISTFGIELFHIELPEEKRQAVLEAQKRQQMINR